MNYFCFKVLWNQNVVGVQILSNALSKAQFSKAKTTKPSKLPTVGTHFRGRGTLFSIGTQIWMHDFIWIERKKMKNEREIKWVEVAVLFKLNCIRTGKEWAKF